ncbi:hypothetical protein BJ742DRAFT_779099 [Cladochytrium replicatum]|nr:hypothetical protein BJ742DRAFT_779099 [Cladochytrium replicatum]
MDTKSRPSRSKCDQDDKTLGLLPTPASTRVTSRSETPPFPTNRLTSSAPCVHAKAPSSTRTDPDLKTWMAPLDSDHPSPYKSLMRDKIHHDVELYIKLMVPGTQLPRSTSCRFDRSDSYFGSASTKGRLKSLREPNSGTSSLRGRESPRFDTTRSDEDYRQLDEQFLNDEMLFRRSHNSVSFERRQ